MLKSEKHKAHSKEKKNIFESRILKTEKDIIKFNQKKKHESEKHAIECMKVNSKISTLLLTNKRIEKIK